jgi:hypothetical protein
MDYKQFKFPGKKQLDIVLLGDVHWGSEQCNKEMFSNTITKIKKDKNIKVILMGDMIENSNRFVSHSGVYEQASPEKQIDEMVELLTPIKDKILYYHRGNHEERGNRIMGIDPGLTIAKVLKIPYVKNMMLGEFIVGKIKYNLFSWHGAGASQTTAGRIRILQRQSESFNADLYTQGHNHDLFDAVIPKRIIENGKFKDIFCHYLLSGSFCNWDGSYAEQYGYPMMKLGCPKITLNHKEKQITVDLNYASKGV